MEGEESSAPHLRPEEKSSAPHLRAKSVNASHSLRHGTFRIQETGRHVNFVLVPEDFTPESGTLVSEVLQALGLAEPEIAFYFHKGTEIGEGSAVVESRMRAVLDGISDACAQTKSLYMLRQPFTGNMLAEMVCDSAAKMDAAAENCPVLGLFHLGAITAVDRTLPADERPSLRLDEWEGRTYLEQKAEYENWRKKPNETGKAVANPHDSKQLPPKVAHHLRYWDAQRVSVGSTIMHPEATAASAKEVTTTIDVSCGMTDLEEKLSKLEGGGKSYLAMLDRVTHAVVFAGAFPGNPINEDGSVGEHNWTAGDLQRKCIPDVTQSCPNQLRFAEMLNRNYPTGIIAAGGTSPLMKSCFECLKSGRPLFCFRGTGGSSDTVASLIDFGKLKKGSLEQPPATAQELEHFIVQRFSADSENWKHEWLWQEARAFARNFPEHFNPAAALVIEVGEATGGDEDVSRTHFSEQAGDSVDALQDQITQVMASVYDKVPELGGHEADKRSLRHALSLHQHLLRAATRYRCEASVLVVFMRLLFLATAVSAALRSDPSLLGSDGNDGGNDGGNASYIAELTQQGLGFFQANDESSSISEDVEKWVAMVLPLLLGVASTVYATYRPIQKFAALKSAAHEIESQAYRFRTRTRPYYAAKSTASGKGHRQLFAAECNRILETHLSSDVRASGVARLAEADHWLHAEDGRPGSRAAKPKHGMAKKRVAPQEATHSRMPAPSAEELPGDDEAWGANPATATQLPNGDRNGAARRPPQASNDLRMMSVDDYTKQRALPELRRAQLAAPRISMQLKVLQFTVIFCSAIMVVFQSELPLWTPVVLTAVSSIEFVISYQQLESQLPAVNGTALAITRVLIWWDGLSLIQQRMPASKDRLVDVVESALVMQHQGFAQGAIANLSKDLQDDKDGGGAAGGAGGSAAVDATSTKADKSR